MYKGPFNPILIDSYLSVKALVCTFIEILKYLPLERGPCRSCIYRPDLAGAWCAAALTNGRHKAAAAISHLTHILACDIGLDHASDNSHIWWQGPF